MLGVRHINISEIITQLNKYEPKGIQHEVPIVWERAKDWTVWDKDGKEYIDFTSGIFVANIGHSNDKVRRTICHQVATEQLHSYIFPTEVRAKLAKKMCELTSKDKILFTVTGSEANEAALQIMQRNKLGAVMSIEGAYYGSTSRMRKLNDGCLIEGSLPDKFESLTDISGLFLQAFRGYNVKFMPKDWVQIWVNWAHEHDIPVAWDEMQSGFGRTGKMFGYQWYDIEPDLITCGKAMGAGLPISCVLGSVKLMSYADDLWSTHSGNPVCCAAAIANLEVIEKEHLVERAANFEKLATPGMTGHGLMWAIDLHDKDYANRVVKWCAEHGLLLLTTNMGTIKIAPPLIIPKTVFIDGMAILLEGIKECI